MSEHLALARQAAHEWDLPEPVLVRVGMNSLFTAGDEVMLRVGRRHVSAESERHFLTSVSALGVRTPRTIADTDMPDGLFATAVERTHAHGEVDWREVGAMIRHVHSLDPSEMPGLPWCADFPHWQFGQLLDLSLIHI